MIRLAHFSDVHLTASPLAWTLRDLFSKRLSSWLNLRFRRAQRFRCADEIVAVLMDELPGRNIDHVTFSGDATALGFESEIRRAAGLLRVATYSIPGLAIPGNHDYLVPAAERSGAFERHFERWQQGRRIGEHRYPFAQQVGPAWLIGVNAATGNRSPFDAGGAVGPEQLARLSKLLGELPAALKILIVHFPVCLSNGERERAHHGLRDLDALLAVANAGGVSLWLHGHRHRPYHLAQPDGAAFPVICAGAATEADIWSYGEYAIEGHDLQAVWRTYDPDRRCFRDAEKFALRLPHPSSQTLATEPGK